jgi:hypothetical protein
MEMSTYCKDGCSNSSSSNNNNNNNIWILRSLDDANEDIKLDFSASDSVVVGRGDIGDCRKAKCVSAVHLEFHTEDDQNVLLVLSHSKFDVTQVDGVLLTKGNGAIVNDGSKVNLCREYIPFIVMHMGGDSDSRLTSGCRKRRRQSCPGGDDSIRVCPHPVGPTQETEQGQGQVQVQGSGTGCNNTEIEEGLNMANNDVESTVCSRRHAMFVITKDLMLNLLSSLHCDICLEIIAGCRSCVPCGHNFCAPCIKQYMAVKKSRCVMIDMCFECLHYQAISFSFYYY